MATAECLGPDGAAVSVLVDANSAEQRAGGAEVVEGVPGVSTRRVAGVRLERGARQRHEPPRFGGKRHRFEWGDDTSKLIIPENRGSTSSKGAERRRDQEKSGEASVP